jgi:hypothetical protein
MKNRLRVGVVLRVGMVVLAAVALGAVTVAAKANFSGVWTLDKSEGLPPGMTQVLTITQNGDRVEVERKVKMAEGEERTVNDAFVLDGKEADFKPLIIGGGATVKKAKRTSKWAEDGNGFDAAEEATLDGPEGEDTIKVTQRWSLSADAKTLTIELDMQGPGGAVKTKRVFVKK